jgi:quercetin dioxygenase-like cupin family protein
MSTGWITRAAGRQNIAWIGGSVHGVLLDGAATGNRLAAFRSQMRAGAASPVHVHDQDDETVFVLEGAGVAWVGDQRWELRSGDSVFMPRHVPHSYVFTAETDLLTVCNPAGMENFFRAAGWDLKDPQPQDWAVDMETLRTSGEAGGQHVLGPPLAPGSEMPAQYLGSSGT